MAVGSVVNLANDWTREKFPEVKEFEDNIGKGVVDTWNSGVDTVQGWFA